MARVLVIEPDCGIRAFVAGILVDLGHDVQQCEGTAEACVHLETAVFDVLATDLVLHDRRSEAAGLAPHLPLTTLAGEMYCIDDTDANLPLPLRARPFRFADLHRLVAAIARCGSEVRAITA